LLDFDDVGQARLRFEHVPTPKERVRRLLRQGEL
jgi:hypothetical protein